MGIGAFGGPASLGAVGVPCSGESPRSSKSPGLVNRAFLQEEGVIAAELCDCRAEFGIV